MGANKTIDLANVIKQLVKDIDTKRANSHVDCLLLVDNVIIITSAVARMTNMELRLRELTSFPIAPKLNSFEGFVKLHKGLLRKQMDQQKKDTPSKLYIGFSQ